MVNGDIQMDIKVTHAGSEQFLVVSGFPFVVKGGAVHKITDINVLCENKINSSPKDFALESVLRPGSGEWYKISVINDGIHKIDYDFLSSIGVNVESLNPNHIHIYGNGDGMLPESNALPRTDDLAQNAIQYVGNSDNSFDEGDYLLFYAWGPNRWVNNGTTNFQQKKNVYSDYSYYFININENVPPKNIETKNPITGTPDEMITSYDYRSCYENDLVSLVGGGQRWYGELFDIDLEQTFNFAVPNITDEPAHFNASIASNASSSAGTLQRYSVNGLVLEESSFAYNHQ